MHETQHIANNQKSIFVTGAGSGIGQAVAKHFGNRQWLVGIADIDPAGLADTAQSVPPGNCKSYIIDVTEPDQWAQAMDDFGLLSEHQLNALVNCAGVTFGGQFADTELLDLHRMIEINLTGTVNGIYAAIPQMQQTKGACIVNIGSAAGLYGAAGMSVYSATKFAIHGLTKALAIELSSAGIRVCEVIPSFVDTKMLDGKLIGHDGSIRERIKAANIPITDVNQVAETVWKAIHGNKVHHLVGSPARKISLVARWAPHLLTKRYHRMQNQ
jgi:short-subunit dehydrogenase